MGLKHRLKGIVRESYARLVWHTGLHRLIDRCSEPRLVILYGHCVDQPATNASLDADMKIDGGRLRALLAALGERYDLVTIAEGVERLDRLRSGESGAPRRSMVALSMDDGYRDNLHDLVPLLESVGARATVFLEGGAVAERRLPWLHALGWLGARLTTVELTARLAERVPSAAEALTGVADANRLKRVLKYDAEPVERDAALATLVAAEGGDAGDLVDDLYLSRDEARALASAECVEVGGHTVNHPVLSRLDETEQTAEIAGGAALLRELLGEREPDTPSNRTFAYPYGRRWDTDAVSRTAAEAAGYRAAVTTHAGVNSASTGRFDLARWPIHDGTRLHLVATEASGGFQLLRRLGLDVVE